MIQFFKNLFKPKKQVVINIGCLVKDLHISNQENAKEEITKILNGCVKDALNNEI